MTRAAADLITSSKGPKELSVPVPDEEPHRTALVSRCGRQATSLLGGPGSGRVSGHASQEDLAALEVDEEQHIEPAQRDCVDVEEVASEVLAAWARRNSDHGGPNVGGAGRKRRRSTLRTLVPETATPSLRHSPTVRR
jgi:hypothetical protein